MPKDAVATYFEGTGLRVIVVPAGTGATEAAAALKTAVSKAPSVQLAMSADALGNVSSLDDSAIVAKAKSLPVDIIAIVRVFDGKEGAKSAVVTLYTPQGATLTAFSAATDMPLAAKKTTGTGMSGSAAAVVDNVVGGASADLEERQKAFEERAIWMQGYAAVDSSTNRVVSTWSVPMKGRYGEALRGAEFYDYVGYADLAAKYRKTQLIRGILAGSGLAVSGGGALYLILAHKEVPPSYGAGRGEPCYKYLDENYNPTAEWRTCRREIVASNTTVNAIGYSLVGVGTVALMVPLFISPHPIPSNERSRLVDEYNDKLKEELGLSSADSGPGPSLAAGAWVGPNSSGLVLSGAF